MLSPSSSTSPCTDAPGITSCIRLSVRSTVDLPQPDGPMNAVTLRGAIVSEQSATALNLP